MRHFRFVLGVGFRATHVLALVVLLAGGAQATSFVEPSTWTVGDAGSTFQEWESGGTSAAPITAGLAHVANPALAPPVLSQVGAFVASSGGFYSFSGNYQVTAAIANHGGPGSGTQLVVQAAATVNPDYDPEGDATGGSIVRDTLTILDADGGVLAVAGASDVTRTFYDANFPLFGGVGYEELAWSVFIPGYTGDFAVTFDEFVHSSLQAVRVDSMIATVPEPGGLALVTIGAAGIGGWHLRRRKAGRRR